VTMWVIPQDLGNFSPKKEKNLGEQKFARLSVSNFHGRVLKSNVVEKLVNYSQSKTKKMHSFGEQASLAQNHVTWGWQACDTGMPPE
jgi:hypothetical protein